MAFDIKSAEGTLVREKVLAELDKILANRSTLGPSSPRKAIIDLIDEAVDAAFMDGMEF